MSNLKKSIRKSLVVGGFCMMSSLAMSAQISLTLENKSTRDVIREIERVSEYRFFYNEDLQGLDQKISINTNDANIQTVLNEIQRQTSIHYVIKENNQIVLSAGVKSNKTQQVGDNRIIKGTILDVTGMPVIGANVMVKGTTNGTITDMDGKFSLEVDKNAILVVSYIGYANQEIKVGNQNTLSITMKEDAEALDEVVVVGYGTTTKKNFTGSVSSLKLEDSPISLSSNTNALDALKGNISGLDIGGTNSAGGTPSMLVRGQNSISGSNDPLLVVDGVIFMGNINDINPGDIASLDVLKDAASAAAYGSRSANGVNSITTKKGKVGKPVITLNVSGSMQNWHRKPELMNGQQWLDAIRDKNRYEDYSFLFPQQKINYDAGREINGLDVVSRTGWLQDYQVSVAGAGEKMNYYLSSSFTDNQGIIKGDDFSRVTVFGKVNTDITDWLQIGLDGSYAHADYSGAGADVFRGVVICPYNMLYRANSTLLEKYTNGTNEEPNPLWNVESGALDDTDLRNNFRMNTFMVVKLPWIEGLSYRLNYTTILNERKVGQFYHENYYTTIGPYDDESRYSVSAQQAFLSNANGFVQNERTISWLIDNILNYKNTIGKHSVDLTLVSTRDSRTSKTERMSGSDFLANGNTVLGMEGLHYAKVQKWNNDNVKVRNVGYFGRASYSFDDTYYLTASYRRDGSSVFGVQRKWGNFWSVSTVWRLTKESFMESVDFLDDLKLKFSWGKNGNQGISPYGTLSRVNVGSKGGLFYPFGNTGVPSYGIAQSNIGNSLLGWETTKSFNAGFESTWLDNRLFVDMDVYFSRTSDQLFDRKIPSMTGFTSMKSSMGEVQNRGVELTLRSVNIQTDAWKWTSNLTFWLNRNKLIHLYGDLDENGKEKDDLGNNLFIGHSIHSIFGYEQDGIVQVTDQDYMDKNGVSAGTPKYVDQDGDGKITVDDRVILGTSDPRFKLNLGNTISWKNLELYFLFTGTFGGNGYYQGGNTPTKIVSLDGATMSNGLYHPYWTEENPSNEYPAAWFTNDGKYLALENRTYVRLQDITVSYTLNYPKIKNLGINNLKIFFTGKNIATITSWKGGDPELGSTLYDWSYPVARSLSLGARISF